MFHNFFLNIRKWPNYVWDGNSNATEKVEKIITVEDLNENFKNLILNQEVKTLYLYNS